MLESVARRILRTVFGGGADISAANPLPVDTSPGYVNISASALIKTGPGRFYGFIVNSCAATATIKFWDQTSAAVPVLLNTITFTLAVSQGPCFCVSPVGIAFTNGLYCTIAVADMDVTILFK